MNIKTKTQIIAICLICTAAILLYSSLSPAQPEKKSQGPAPVPVRTAPVILKTVSDQITLIGTAEAVAESTIAAEVSGIVEDYPVREGDFVEKGSLLTTLNAAGLALEHKGAVAERERIKASLVFAEKELNRFQKLKDANSVSEKQYDEALYNYTARQQELNRSQAAIEQLEYDIARKKVTAPFSGFAAKEHTQVGEWINAGGPVVTLVDLSRVQITVDVPERYANQLKPESRVQVTITSVPDTVKTGVVRAVLPKGDAAARTFPVRIELDNPDLKIKAGMEAVVIFDLASQKEMLLVPKDAVVTSGTGKMIFMVADGKAAPVPVEVTGYFGGEVSVAGNLKPGMPVVIRGNERLQPGQGVVIQDGGTE